MANIGREAALPYLKAFPKLEDATLFGLKKNQKKTKTHIAFSEKEKVLIYSLPADCCNSF